LMKDDDNRRKPYLDQAISAKGGEESILDGLTVRTPMQSGKKSSRRRQQREHPGKSQKPQHQPRANDMIDGVRDNMNPQFGQIQSIRGEETVSDMATPSAFTRSPLPSPMTRTKRGRKSTLKSKQSNLDKK